MKRVYVLLGIALTALSMAYFASAIAQHWQSMKSIQLLPATFVACACAALIYASTYIATSKAWQLSLRSIGVRITLASSIRILTVAQFAKYLPGNVGHHVGRVLLAKKAGIAGQPTLVSMVIDSVAVVGAAAIWTLPSYSLALFLAERSQIDFIGTSLLVFAITTLLVIFLFVGPLRSRFRTALASLAEFSDPSRLGLLLGVLLAHSVSFVAGGYVLYVIAGSLADSSSIVPDLLFNFVGIYSAAWLLGFLLPGAPAGLGVREACLLIGLSPMLGEQNALIAAALLRLVTTATDGLVFLAGLAASASIKR
jgi:glycosyltransferase 2 family protein